MKDFECIRCKEIFKANPSYGAEVLCPECGNGARELPDCIFWGRTAGIDTCTIIDECHAPGRCGIRLECRKDLPHKPTEDELRDIFREVE